MYHTRAEACQSRDTSRIFLLSVCPETTGKAQNLSGETCRVDFRLDIWWVVYQQPILHRHKMCRKCLHNCFEFIPGLASTIGFTENSMAEAMHCYRPMMAGQRVRSRPIPTIPTVAGVISCCVAVRSIWGQLKNSGPHSVPSL